MPAVSGKRLRVTAIMRLRSRDGPRPARSVLDEGNCCRRSWGFSLV